jgi:glycosyltransferase involved in cell wall biosynthesis
MTLPRISIITPTFNAGHFIEQSIRGVLYQDYPNLEHIVIDGASTDETISILRKYPHLKWVSEPDKGLSDAFNKGIRMATGDIVGWCSADDYYLPGAFKVCIDVFQNDPTIMFLYGDYREIDVEGIPLRIRREIDFDLFILKHLHVSFIAPPASFWRKTLHDDGLMFSEELHYAMDYEFILRSAIDGRRFHHIPTLLCDFRVHSNAKSANPKQRIEHEQIRQLYIPFYHDLPPYINLILGKATQNMARIKRTFKRAAKGHYFEQWWRT